MLRITNVVEPKEITLEVEGKLSGDWTRELAASWKEAMATAGGRKIHVHLRCVSYVDATGKQLLAQMHADGVELSASGCLNNAIVREIIGKGGEGEAKNHRRGWALWILALLLAAPSLRAQQPETLRLTLHDAVALALRQNPQVQIAVLNLAESVQDKNIARADLLPQASLETSDSAFRGNVEAAFGQRFPGLAEHYGPYQIFSAGTQLSASVFDLSLWRKWQAAKSNERASDEDRISVREQVTLLVVSQYLSCLRARADVSAAQSRVDLAQALYDQAADLQKHGAGTGLDSLRANVELQNEKQRLLVAQTSEKTSLYGLAQLLDVDPNQSIELEDAMSFFQTPDTNLQENLDASVSARPEMRALNAREKALVEEKEAISESRLPTARFVGSWDYLGISITTGIPAYNYAVVFDVPVFTGGRIHAENARADLELIKIARERDALKDEIALEVKTAAADLASARNEVDVANQGVSLAQEEVQQARDRFTAGVANNIEVISAQDALARANDNQIAALYRYNQARADLAHSSGQMETFYGK
jgi:outer membrane protein TolC/anti-anti-sigma regulatory factor